MVTNNFFFPVNQTLDSKGEWKDLTCEDKASYDSTLPCSVAASEIVHWDYTGGRRGAWWCVGAACEIVSVAK